MYTTVVMCACAATTNSEQLSIVRRTVMDSALLFLQKQQNLSCATWECFDNIDVDYPKALSRLRNVTM